MKIYNEVVIDIASGEVEYEDSYEYEGDLALCGGGGGGGGSVEYPEHMLAQHQTLISAQNKLRGENENPWRNRTAYDPSAVITGMYNNASKLNTTLSGMVTTGVFNNLRSYVATQIANIQSGNDVDDLVTDFADKAQQRFNDRLGLFQAGMRDINAVQSSAFVIGEAIMYAEDLNAVSTFAHDAVLRSKSDEATKMTDLWLKAGQTELQAFGAKLEHTKAVAHMLADLGRIEIVAKKEQRDMDGTISHSRHVYEWDKFSYGGNLLASIGSASVQTGLSRSPAQSAIGGALSGAAAGAMIGAGAGGIGAIPGAAVGGILGAAAGLLGN